jgi:hypothetical protein
MFRSPGPAAVATQPREHQAPSKQAAAWRQPVARERILALQAAAGNRAVARTIVPQLRVACAPPVKPPPVKPPPVTPPAGGGQSASKDGWVIHPEAMKLLETKLTQLYEKIPRRDRIWLKHDSTIAIGMATVDGEVRLVYTTANNRGRAEFHGAAEQLGLHRWRYDSGVKGRGAVGAPNDAEQLMRGFAEDNHAVLHGVVLNRRMCKDCATVLPAYGGGRLRIAVVRDPADLPNPYNRPAPLTPPAGTASGEIDTSKPRGGSSGALKGGPDAPHRTPGTPAKTGDLPEGSVFARPRPAGTPYDVQPPIIAVPKAGPAGSSASKSAPPTPPAAPKAAPVEVPIEVPANARTSGRVAPLFIPAGIMTASFLAGLAVNWYLNKLFKQDWEATMARVESWLKLYLPTLQPPFKAGAPLFAHVEISVATGSMYTGEGGWAPERAGVGIESIQVKGYPAPAWTWVEKSPWWTMALGFTYEETHVKFSFPLPVTGTGPK